MCGLAGFLGGRLSGDERRATVVAMTDRIAHRGPDDTGQFFVDRDALALYFRYTNVPAPFTIYRGIRKVMPGTIVAVNARGETREITYWSAAAVAEHGATHRFAGSEDEAADRLDALLRDAVGLRMIADVPLGVFLSGGIDSSIVTAMMQAQSSAPVKTFSIGFAEEDFNEAVHAARVAKH